MRRLLIWGLPPVLLAIILMALLINALSPDEDDASSLCFPPNPQQMSIDEVARHLGVPLLRADYVPPGVVPEASGGLRFFDVTDPTVQETGPCYLSIEYGSAVQIRVWPSPQSRPAPWTCQPLAGSVYSTICTGGDFDRAGVAVYATTDEEETMRIAASLRARR